jgi:hypothetical protein
MLHEPIALPESEGTQIRELNRVLQGGTPALIGALAAKKSNCRMLSYRLLKDIVRNMQLGRADRPDTREPTTDHAAGSRPAWSFEAPSHQAAGRRRVAVSQGRQSSAH